MIIPVYADTFEGSDKENYIYLEITNGTAKATVKIDNKINTIISDVKYYYYNIEDIDNNFLIESIPTNLILLGTLPIENNVEFEISYIDNIGQKFTIPVQRFDTTPIEKPVELTPPELTPLEKYQQSLNQTTGMPYIEDILKAEEEKRLEEEELKRIEEEKNKPQRSEYTLSTEREIVIVEESPRRIPYYKGFDFDILVIDPAKNPNLHEDRGWIDDVEISAIIKDPFKNILKTFTGITEDRGTFSPDSKTYFSDIYKSKPYSLEINAKKYFDDNFTFATASLSSYFYLYYPGDSSGSSCGANETQIPGGSCVVNCEDGYEFDEEWLCVSIP